MPDEQRLFGDRYQLVRHIARGGMAQVYLARDLLLDRPVALKVLFPELSVDESFVERFRLEARAAANLSHPNIVSIYDWGKGERTYFIVMEYVDGETLSARIRRGALPPDQAAIVAIATASALAFAHRRQVIHRDVKPGNVLIDRSGQVKVADFGIARAVGTAENLTQAGAVMGTATYFSPEQAQGFAVDARSDVYSLGVVLYEMVAGHPPFQGDNPVAIAYKHVREAPPAVTVANPAIPRAYEAITLKALAKDPDARYQTADELRADLERFRAGQPVLALASPGADATTVVAGGAAQGLGANRVNPAPVPTTVARTDATTTMGPVGPPPPGRATFEDPESRNGLYAALLVGLLVVLGLLVFFVGRDLGLFGGGAKTLTVPSVAGEPAATARADLQSAGFTSVSEKTVTSATVSSGDAVGTDPPARSRLKSDDALVLQVSGGPGQVPVPLVGGQTKAAATAALEKAGFKVTASTQPSGSVTKGDVITTNPAPGTSQARGITVQLIVSSGPKNVTVPTLTYQNPATAAATLSRDGLDVLPSQNEASSTVPAGEVTRTVPAAESQVPAGTPITIYVSTGPAQVPVPSGLTGDTVSQAEAALTKADLTYSVTQVPVSDQSQNGLVQSTDPPAGTMVPAGSSVTLSVGMYTGAASTTTTPGSSTTTTSTTSPTPPT